MTQVLDQAKQQHRSRLRSFKEDCIKATALARVLTMMSRTDVTVLVFPRRQTVLIDWGDGLLDDDSPMLCGFEAVEQLEQSILEYSAESVWNRDRP